MKQILLFLICLIAIIVGAVDVTAQHGENDSLAYYRNLWKNRIQGNNLAKGKKVTFSIPTNYRLTKDEKDYFDLTDGKLAPNKKDLIWFEKDTVGWFGGVSDGGVNFQIDLGSVKNIDRFVIRCLGGEVQKTLGFPKRFEIYVSKDGKNYYQTAKLQKLAESDRELSDFKHNFYIPERGKAIVYPFEFEVNAQARYIAFTIASSAGGLFTDELAVLEGNPKKAGFNSVYKKEPKPFYTQGLLVRPKYNEFVLSKNIITPVFFSFMDMRLPAQKKSPMLVDIDLPEGVSAISPKAVKEEKYTDNKGQKRIKLTMKVAPRPWSQGLLKQIFFKVTKDIPQGSKAYFTSYSQGVQPIKQEFPFEVINIAKVPQLKRFHISLGWMHYEEAVTYPEFFQAWQTIGFNAVNGFPRYFNPATTAKREAFFDNVRAQGMKVLMTDSPIHAMPGRGIKGHELNCIVDKPLAVCPSYRGKLHQLEVKRIQDCVVKSKPDIIFFDIELFYGSHVSSKKCSRCLAAMKAANMTNMDDFAKKVVAQRVADFQAAVKRGAEQVKIKCPPIGLYGKGPGIIDRSQPVLDWDHLYPNSIAIAQPSLYVGERPWLVNERVRKTAKLMKNKNIIPWLTAGTYGDLRAQFVEYIALEALLNGAGGFTYFAYWDFDNPRKYAALAKALRLIAPYENLIMDGKLVEIPVAKVNTTAVRKGNEVLLLVGNYQYPDLNVSIPLPFENIQEIKDLRDGEKLAPNKNLKLSVKRSSIRLIYIKLK